MNYLVSLIRSIKPGEWASIIFGTTGLIVSLSVYTRSRQNERRAFQLQFAQERQDALVLVQELQLSDERLRHQIGENLKLARNIAIPEIIEGSARILALMDGSREQLTTMKKLLDRFTTGASSKHECLVTLRGDVMTQLRQAKSSQEQRLSSFKRLEERMHALQAAVKEFESYERRVLNMKVERAAKATA